MRKSKFVTVPALALVLLLAAACTSAPTEEPPAAPTPMGAAPAETGGGMATEESSIAGLSGSIAVDGSSTVYPITEAVAEEFGAEHPDVRVAVGIAGTGGGFKKFCNAEIDINDASRPIKDEEAEACATGGVEYTEFQVGLDGISVVVNPENDWAECLTVEQLKAIWDQDSAVDSWQDVDPSFPDQPITLYGPGTDSGTFDFFTEEINGEAKRSRPDYTASEDDNTLVQGISGDKGGLAYFGLAYYLENLDKVKDVAVDGGAGCVNASVETVADGSYAPLSRPLFVYVNNAALERPEVYEFLKFYLTKAIDLVPAVQYVALDQAQYDQALLELEPLAP